MLSALMGGISSLGGGGGGAGGIGLPAGGYSASSEATGGDIGGNNRITPEGLRQADAGSRGINLSFAGRGAIQTTKQASGVEPGGGFDLMTAAPALLGLGALVVAFLIFKKG